MSSVDEAQERMLKRQKVRIELKRMARENELNEINTVRIERMKNEIMELMNSQHAHIVNIQAHFNNAMNVYTRVLENQIARMRREFRNE